MRKIVDRNGSDATSLALAQLLIAPSHLLRSTFFFLPAALRNRLGQLKSVSVVRCTTKKLFLKGKSYYYYFLTLISSTFFIHLSTIK